MLSPIILILVSEDPSISLFRNSLDGGWCFPTSWPCCWRQADACLFILSSFPLSLTFQPQISNSKITIFDVFFYLITLQPLKSTHVYWDGVDKGHLSQRPCVCVWPYSCSGCLGDELTLKSQEDKANSGEVIELNRDEDLFGLIALEKLFLLNFAVLWPLEEPKPCYLENYLRS